MIPFDLGPSAEYNHPFLARFFKKSLFINMKESTRNFLVALHVTEYSRGKNIPDGNHYV